MKKIANLKGVKTLSRNQQKMITGGRSCQSDSDCVDPTVELVECGAFCEAGTCSPEEC